MATLILGAAGAALGAGFGGTVLGLSGAVIGRAIGATIGRSIDQRILGGGSEPVEVGRLDRLRLTGASEGAAIPRIWGRMRVAGQVLWASPFVEHSTSRRAGGKGGSGPKATEYSYSCSLAIGLCAGEILRIGRIWADGNEIEPAALNLRLYHGTEDQLPDPRLEAEIGVGQVPAYRGLAYVVIEDLALSPYGNRVPQLTFEVARAAQGPLIEAEPGLQEAVQAVALIPGTGEYALSTRPISLAGNFLLPGAPVNMNNPSGKTDFAASLAQLQGDLPNCRSVSLVVSWFGDDLRCGACSIRPKVEQLDRDGQEMPWAAGGIVREEAQEITRIDGRSVYGGTPSDQSVIEAIRAMRAAGQEVMFYPFILMEQLAGNGRPDPWTGAEDQPVLPWRGRITTAKSRGHEGTTDRTAGAEAEVAAFFGTCLPSDFSAGQDTVAYGGPEEWGMRRFTLHYAHLCQLAGGVDAFCIGSEMVGLTRIRGAGDSFPAVEAFRRLAEEVKAILGPDCAVSYAADWTEYGGYQADGNIYFPLDPLWADPAVDFIGIDNSVSLT